MTTYMNRSEWTSTRRGGAQLTGSKLQGLACHWPGSSTSAYGIESADAVAHRLRGWRTYHVNGRSWSDIGYNFAIDQAGRVWDLRGSGRVGAHAASASNPDANHEYVGVLFIVGADEEPTDDMVYAFWHFCRDVFLVRWPGRTDVRGHGEVTGASTACPGPAISDLADISIPTRPSDPEEDDDMAITDEEMEWIARRAGEWAAHLILQEEVRASPQAEAAMGDRDSRGTTVASLLGYAAIGGIRNSNTRTYDAATVWDHEEPNPASQDDKPTRMSQFIRSLWNRAQ